MRNNNNLTVVGQFLIFSHRNSRLAADTGIDLIEHQQRMQMLRFFFTAAFRASRTREIPSRSRFHQRFERFPGLAEKMNRPCSNPVSVGLTLCRRELPLTDHPHEELKIKPAVVDRQLTKFFDHDFAQIVAALGGDREAHGLCRHTQFQTGFAFFEFGDKQIRVWAVGQTHDNGLKGSQDRFFRAAVFFLVNRFHPNADLSRQFAPDHQ